ncbi:MAG: hypothetical protein EBV24_07540 [Actinobacteria bacterium]|nr:hypothetical protein [Actinomycetota bacterium]
MFGGEPRFGRKVAHLGGEGHQPLVQRRGDLAIGNRGESLADQVPRRTLVPQECMHGVQRLAIGRHVPQEALFSSQPFVFVTGLDASLENFRHLESEEIDLAIARLLVTTQRRQR